MPEKIDFKIKTGGVSALIHRVPVLHIRLGIDPHEAASKDDKFKLTSDDGKYEKTLTIKDDKVEGDDFVDLVFENLKVSKKYTLKIDPGAEGESYNLFEDVPFTELIDFYSMPEPGEELDEDDSDDQRSGKSMEDSEWDDDGEQEESGGDAEDGSGIEDSTDDEEERAIDEGINDPENVSTDSHYPEEEYDDTGGW